MPCFKHSLNFLLIRLLICQYGLVSLSQAVFDKAVEQFEQPSLFHNEPDLFLTVSSEPDCPRRRWFKPWSWFTETKCDRRLELNWINFDKYFHQNQDHSEVVVQDYVGVFQWDPTSNASPQPLPPPPNDHRCPVKSVSQAASGYFKTTLRYENSGLNISRGLKNPCISGYWIAYVRTTSEINHTSNHSIYINPLDTSSSIFTTIVSSKCLGVHPFWIQELKSAIGDLPVTSLMIPGTHNSGSWEAYKGLLQSEINLLSALEITQEESIYDQLIHGIRYLDVRVTHHPFLPTKFWVSHDSLVPQIPLTVLLADIQRFHEETNKKEILFVDFHRVSIHSIPSTKTVKGINHSESQANIHSELIQLIDKYIGRYLVPHHNNANILTVSAESSSLSVPHYSRLTPNTLWKWNRTIFVTYPNQLMRKQYTYLWPPFQHSWANTNNISVLEKYLEEDLLYFGCTNRFWTLMAELTATASDVATKPHVCRPSWNGSSCEWTGNKMVSQEGLVFKSNDCRNRLLSRK